MPYEFPSGRQLLAQILVNLSDEGSAKFQQLQSIHCDVFNIRRFRDSLHYSDANSVDAFLEHRSEFLNVGKLAIAQALTPYESKDVLFSRKSAMWYDYLFSKLNTDYSNFDNNKLSIITYNYDRSLEAYFYTALLNRYGKSHDEVVKKLNSIKIVHIHGMLGKLPWQVLGTDKSREYVDDSRNDAAVLYASTGIRVIHEISGPTPELEEARQLIRSNERIVFLGFGFHETNVRRLNIPTDKRGLMGSGFQITAVEQAEYINKYFPSSFSFGHPTHDVITYLRESVTL